MRNIGRVFACVLLFAFQLRATAQLGTDQAPQERRYDTGVIAKGVYNNECMGFSLPIPDGWDLKNVGGDTDTTRIGIHMPDGSIYLLMMDRHAEPPSFYSIVILAVDAKRFNGNAKDFVDRSVNVFVHKDPVRYELLHSASPVDFGGRHFYLSDAKENLQNGGVRYLGYIFTAFRGYLLGEVIMAPSAAVLDSAADSLQHISFAADQVDPACIVGDNTRTGAMVGIVGSVSNSVPAGTKVTRVRVSSTVADGLVVKKEEPKYPADVVKAGNPGPVVLHVMISKEGNVEANITVVSGDPKIVPAVLDAVKNWKFKPYLLNGQPVEVDTVLTVRFEAPR